ncbi:DUF3465 domain-containing protein [Methylomonas methanica]|uniref:DUF3465 domain-containing protein n=1 Tax=Methylomonas methanica (strain DSM 25384 / MC09) TaxID=857087 RepID=F9ZZG9_METMM|nr:DUF3465 domain-containing protein [Methylomonas methanica]AEG02362.1 hypothetical protein Metme_4009 [Methylomonas methanica MC09]
MIKAVMLAVLFLLAVGMPLAWADTPYSASDTALQQAFRSHRSDLRIDGEGVVIKLLPDDNHGSRHQRFILRLRTGQTLLIAHNIDLAPKIENLRVGDTVSFYGEYEWSEKGGTVHWTHRDPGRRHADGWLKVAGQVYQ